MFKNFKTQWWLGSVIPKNKTNESQSNDLTDFVAAIYVMYNVSVICLMTEQEKENKLPENKNN